MDSNAWTAIVAGLVTIATTWAGVVMAYLALRTKMLEIERDQKVTLGEVETNVKKIEIHTNSMKDALIAATEELALLKGADIERVRAKAEAASVARGGAAERNRSDTEQAALDTAEHTEKSAALLESIDEKTDDPPKGKAK